MRSSFHHVATTIVSPLDISPHDMYSACWGSVTWFFPHPQGPTPRSCSTWRWHRSFRALLRLLLVPSLHFLSHISSCCWCLNSWCHCSRLYCSCRLICLKAAVRNRLSSSLTSSVSAGSGRLWDGSLRLTVCHSRRRPNPDRSFSFVRVSLHRAFAGLAPCRWRSLDSSLPASNCPQSDLNPNPATLSKFRQRRRAGSCTPLWWPRDISRERFLVCAMRQRSRALGICLPPVCAGQLERTAKLGAGD
jgi:hypothetical protein